jgi:hypothetical protein
MEREHELWTALGWHGKRGKFDHHQWHARKQALFRARRNLKKALDATQLRIAKLT